MIERKPIVTSPTNTRQVRYSKNHCSSQMIDIRCNLLSHLGDYALLYRTEKREMLPILVELIHYYPCFILARYKTYDPQGCFRQYLYASIQYSSLYCGEEKLFFFEPDI